MIWIGQTKNDYWRITHLALRDKSAWISVPHIDFVTFTPSKILKQWWRPNYSTEYEWRNSLSKCRNTVFIKNIFQLIWQRIGIHEAATPWFNRMHPSDTSSTTNNPYYQALDPALIARVYHYYFLDFEMFQYSILDVLREGGHCQGHDCSDMDSYFRQ